MSFSTPVYLVPFNLIKILLKLPNPSRANQACYFKLNFILIGLHQPLDGVTNPKYKL